MKLLFVGDVMLGRLVNRALKEAPPQRPWGNTIELFRKADARFCNLECVISDRGTPWSATPKSFHFRSDAKNVAVLKAAGIDAVSLANNHVLDFEEEALLDTLDHLDRNRISRAGAGRSVSEAESPATVPIKGQMAAFFAFTDNEPGWNAEGSRPGVHYLPVDPKEPRAKRFFRRIGEASENTDLVIVSAHWGSNWGYDVPETHIAFAHALVDAGAGVVFGHSPHVFRGIEIHRGAPILYSTGDFVDDYAVDEVERNDESFIFVIDLNKGKAPGITLYPTTIDRFQANLAKGLRAESIAGRMMALCRTFHTRLTWQERERRAELPAA